jgi:hypothetical protein
MLIALMFMVTMSQQAEPKTVTISNDTPATALNPGTLPERPREGDRLICRSETVIGSNRRKRICMTAEQRQMAREQSEQFRSSINGQIGRQAPTSHEQILSGW